MNEPDPDCKWLLREKKYTRDEKSEPVVMGENGRIYCMYTCTVTKNRPAAEKILFVDMSCCPYMTQIANTCPIINEARVLESYYICKRAEADSFK